MPQDNAWFIMNVYPAASINFESCLFFNHFSLVQYFSSSGGRGEVPGRRGGASNGLWHAGH